MILSLQSSLSLPCHATDQNASYSQGTSGSASSTYINQHNSIPRGFEAEVFTGGCPSCHPTKSIRALKAECVNSECPLSSCMHTISKSSLSLISGCINDIFFGAVPNI